MLRTATPLEIIWTVLAVVLGARSIQNVLEPWRVARDLRAGRAAGNPNIPAGVKQAAAHALVAIYVFAALFVGMCLWFGVWGLVTPPSPYVGGWRATANGAVFILVLLSAGVAGEYVHRWWQD